MAVETTPVAPGGRRGRWVEHAFFASAGVTLLIYAGVGFAPTYFLAGFLVAKLPSVLVHVHAVLFVGWLCLFVVQIILAAVGRTRWHRSLGTGLAVWAMLMVLIGPPVVVIGLRRPHSGVDGQALFGDLAQILTFATLIACALLRRRDRAAHKRLMLLGTSAIILPALARWPEWLSLPEFVGLYLLAPIALVAFDLTTLKRVHPVSAVGLLIMGGLVALTIVVPPTSIWTDVTQFVRTF